VTGQHIAIFFAGVAAGAINAAVGSGTLITFPVLIGFGYAPVVANVSNTVGLVPGSAAGAWGYRGELAGRRALIVRLATASVLGGITGAILLLQLPPAAFKAVVPAFIAMALVLVVAQPWLVRVIARRREDAPSPHGGLLMLAALYVTGVYGGYFGAAQGIVLLAVLGVLLNDSLQRANGIKNVLAGLTNLAAGITFATSTHVDWTVALLIAVGSTIGGYAGAHLGRRLPDAALRALIVGVGTYAIVKLVA
jgi:uncharacterized protein